MKYTHIIWDFNGTILNDVDIGIESVNRLLEPRGLKKIESIDEYHELFRFPIIDYYKSLGFDFEKDDYYTVLAPEWVAAYMELVPGATVYEGVTETLEYFSNANVGQVLLSATEIEQLKTQIHELGIEKYFCEVIGLDNIHAKSKAENAKVWMQKHPDARPLFVGDTEHDAEVAKAVGADCILVACGHQSRDILERCGCVVCDDLYKLIEFLSDMMPSDIELTSLSVANGYVTMSCTGSSKQTLAQFLSTLKKQSNISGVLCGSVSESLDENGAITASYTIVFSFTEFPVETETEEEAE